MDDSAEEQHRGPEVKGLFLDTVLEDGPHGGEVAVLVAWEWGWEGPCFAVAGAGSEGGNGGEKTEGCEEEQREEADFAGHF
jgi:hypothetical protein